MSGSATCGATSGFNRQQLAVESTTIGADAFEKHLAIIKFYERVDGKYISGPTKMMARTRVLSGVSSLT